MRVAQGMDALWCFIMDTTMKMDDNWGYPIYGDLMKPPLELFPQDLSKSWGGAWDKPCESPAVKS
jgi:hypothetical protein